MKIKSFRQPPIFGKMHFKVTDWDINGRKPYLNISDLSKKYKNIILQVDGGGIKGLMDAYAMYVIEENTGSIHNSVNTYYGTSTGAIIAAMIANGMSARDILRFYIEEGPNIFHENFLGGLIDKPVFNPDKLMAMLNQMLGDLTFKQLLEQKGKHLTIITVEAQNRETWFCTPESRPDMRIADAVMGSTSVPIIFPPHECKEGVFYDGFLGNFASAAAEAADNAFDIHKWKAEDFILLSFGTGTYYPNYSISKIKSMNKLENAKWMMSSLVNGMVQYQVSLCEEMIIERNLNFCRWDIKLPEILDMTDDNTDNIPRLLELVENYSIQCI
jgi:patatin-like phospholipase/acyl hydrolase